MNLFNRSKKESAKQYVPAPPLPKECEHKFQDFPWYIETDFHNAYYTHERIFKYQIVEPYVCIYCKQRKNIILEMQTITGIKYDEAIQIKNKIEEKYQTKLKPRAIVEDMINDFQLIDIEHLRWYHYLKGIEDPSASQIKNKIEKDIKLKL